MSFELEIKQEFLEEALLNLSEVQGLFEKLEIVADSSAMLDKMFFVAHNLKGGSLSVGFNEIAEFTNQLEALILKIRANEIKLSPVVIATIKKSNKRLVEMLQALKADFEASFDNSEFLSDLQNLDVKHSKLAN